MSPKLCGIALAIVPPLMLLTRAYGKYVKSITKQVQDSLAASTQVSHVTHSYLPSLLYFLAIKFESPLFCLITQTILKKIVILVD